MIPDIACPGCKDFTWDYTMEPRYDLEGHPHHPACEDVNLTRPDLHTVEESEKKRRK